jgi:plastocyanin
MRKVIVILIILAVAAFLLQQYTGFKALDYVKGWVGKIDFQNIWKKITGLRISGLQTPTSTPADKFLNIFMRDTVFVPNSNAVLKGMTVIWYNEDDKIHTVTGENWGSGEIKPGEKYSRVFDMEGDYKYHCSLHPSMTGKLIVK